MRAGYVLVGAAGTRGPAAVVSVVLGEPSEAARDADTLALLRWGLTPLPARRSRSARTGRWRRPRSSTATSAPSSCRGAAVALTVRAGSARAPPGVGARTSSRARWPAGTRVGTVSVLVDGRVVRRVALVTAVDVPGAGTVRVVLSALGVPLTLLLLLGILLAASPGRAADPRAAAAGQMIITVTLNAAIDKTLAVPNFRLGRRHRAVEQTAMAGGKGVNVARALKALGQPVIATGVAGGPTGTRIIEQLTDEAILNDFVRIREESRTSTAVIDPTSGEQTEINEHGPPVSESELELFVDKLLYLAKGAAMCVFSGSLPRGVGPGPLRAPDRRAQAARRDHRARLRGRAAAARHARRPTSSAPTSSRPRSSSATSSPTRRTA